MMRSIQYFSLLTAAIAKTVTALLTNQDDLLSYVSRPDLKPPKFNITTYDASLVSPGYWFIAPYTSVNPEAKSKLFQPCQVGPHIYDSDGNLVWSGACMFDNRITYDFRVVDDRDTPELSFVLSQVPEGVADRKGVGILMNSSFQVCGTVQAPAMSERFDMHEFRVIENGETRLIIATAALLANVSDLDLAFDKAWIANQGFQEINSEGQVVFEWWALDHVALTESRHPLPDSKGSAANSWDPYHMNSVEKDANGDYLISARHTDCIYKISGKDGSILWRLGGTKSSFILDGFNFSGQHDARFRSVDDSITTISFLDNAADASRSTHTSEFSSAMVVELHTSASPMIAKLIKRYPRPDGRLSYRRGNAQVLPNSNIVAGWSANGYTSEFTDAGRLVLEARFLSRRFDTYRSYKFPFVGTPTSNPDLKAYVYGTSPRTMTTVFYVSWNGATEVTQWRYYGAESSDGHFRLLGDARKTGFETVFQAAGFAPWIFAEAVDAKGVVLGKSDIQESILPPGFVGCKTKACDETGFSPKDIFSGRGGLDSFPTAGLIILYLLSVLGMTALLNTFKRRRRLC